MEDDADDEKALKRLRNREAQQRSREKRRRAQEAVVNVKLAELRLALATATRDLYEKRGDSAALRRRADKAVCSQTRPLPVAEPPSDAPGPSSESLGRQASARSAKALCAIYVSSDGAGRRHLAHVAISRSRIGCNGLGMEARIDAFRAAAAERLNCDVRDILWLFESDIMPALTQTSGVRTLVDTPDSVARSALLWPVGQLKIALHHCIAARLEAHLAQLRQRRDDPAASCHSSDGSLQDWGRSPPSPRTNLPPSVLDPPPAALSDRGDRGDRSARDASAPPSPGIASGRESSASWRGSAATSGAPSSTVFAAEHGDVSGCDSAAAGERANATDSLADRMIGFYTAEKRPNHDAFRSPGPVPCGAATACRTVADTRAFASRVFAGVLQPILPHAHPADVIKTARRFRATHSMKGSRAADEPLSMSTAFRSVVEGVDQVLQETCARMSADAVLPRLPTRAGDVEALIAEHRRQAADAKLEFLAFWYIVSMDRAGYSVTKERRLLVERSSVSKALNALQCYRDLALHTQQKLRLAAMLADCRARVEGLRREHAAALRALEQLPSALDAMTRDFGSLFAVSRGAVAPTAPRSAPPQSRPGVGFLEWSVGGFGAKASPSAPGGFAGCAVRSPPWSPCSGDDAAAASSLAQATGCTSPPGLCWSQHVLGASGEETAAAGEALAALRAALLKFQHLRLTMRGSVRDVLSWKQHATLFDLYQPTVEQFRLCEMAAADLRCDRAFARPAIDGPLG